MKQDIHPLWKSTDESPPEQEEAVQDAHVVPSAAADSAAVHRIPIQGKHSTAVTAISIGAAAILFLAFIFVQGVSFLTANIMQDSVVQDSRASNDESEEKLEIPLPMLEPNNAIPLQLNSTPTNVPEIIQLGEEPKAAFPLISWPAMLKVNRFTVGSALVPDLSRMVQISIDALGKRTEQLHNAAAGGGSNSVIPVSRAPETGPGLLALVILCGMLVMFGAKKRIVNRG